MTKKVFLTESYTLISLGKEISEQNLIITPDLTIIIVLGNVMIFFLNIDVRFIILSFYHFKCTHGVIIRRNNVYTMKKPPSNKKRILNDYIIIISWTLTSFK